MRFLPGQSGNPSGRGKGAKGGRSRALVTLDKMLAKHANQIALSRALEVELRKESVRFFRTIIMPLLPRESRLAEPSTWYSCVPPLRHLVPTLSRLHLVAPLSRLSVSD